MAVSQEHVNMQGQLLFAASGVTLQETETWKDKRLSGDTAKQKDAKRLPRQFQAGQAEVRHTKQSWTVFLSKSFGKATEVES